MIFIGANQRSLNMSNKTRHFFNRVFLLFIILVGFNSSYAKSIVVLLDNSASMLFKGDAQMSQCDGAIFALQVMISTLDKEDNLFLVLAYKKGEEVTVLKNPTIDEVKQISCSNASVYNSLIEAIRLTEKIEDSKKKLVFLGDGEWFIEGDELTADKITELENKLNGLSSDTEISYINTSEISNENNEFAERIISDLNEIRAVVDVKETNQVPSLLMEKIDETTKTLLNIPAENNQEFYINGNSLRLSFGIPLKSIFILIQSSEADANLKIEEFESMAGQDILLTKSHMIEKGGLKGGFYELSVNNDLIKPNEIKVFLNKNVNESYKISVFYRPGIKSESPVPCTGISLLGYSNNIYTVCDSLSAICFEYKLRDILGGRLSDDILNNAEISFLDKNKKFINKFYFNEQEKKFVGDLTLSGMSEPEYFFIKVSVNNEFEDIHEIQIVKRPCIELNINSNDFEFTHHLSRDSTFFKSIQVPVIFDKSSTASFPEEKEFLGYKIEGDTGSYNVKRIEDEFIIENISSSCNLICNCLRQPKTNHIIIQFEHQNVNTPASYDITINQVDYPFWERCWKLLLYFIIGLLALLYLIKIKRKPRFYHKGGRKAVVEKFENPDKHTTFCDYNKTLKTSFVNRYINPYGKENLRFDGLHFIAEKGENVNVTMQSIKRVREDNSIVYFKKRNQTTRTKITNRNTQLINLKPGDAVEFENVDLKELIRYQYIISNQ